MTFHVLLSLVPLLFLLPLSMQQDEFYDQYYEDFEPHIPYTLKPNKIGAIVEGFNLLTDMDEHMAYHLKRDLYLYRMLVFKKQGRISPKEHIKITSWFGDLEDSLKKHPSSPDNRCFKMSNDKKHGFTKVGSNGWRNDGWNRGIIRPINTYHMTHIPKKAKTTDFCDTYKLFLNLHENKRVRWQIVWTRSSYNTSLVMPLSYIHPFTRGEVIGIHLGFVDQLIIDANKLIPTPLDEKRSNDILVDIIKEIENDYYSHEWEEGDFIMTDNMAIIHRAGEDADLPVEEIGLRVMQRVSTSYDQPPMKDPPFLTDGPLRKWSHVYEKMHDEL